MIRKAVIPAAGFGTRLLPVTKEQPKEMLPIFDKCIQGDLVVKPILQVIFEQLYVVGVREFCFIVGKGKRSISDHFTSDNSILRMLEQRSKQSDIKDILNFYQKINTSSQVFINQPEPKGFGDAVLRAEPYIKESFIVQAGDTLILSKENHHLKKLKRIHKDYDTSATFLIKDVIDPRPFGIIEGHEVEKNVYEVAKVVEKPDKPTSKLAITALYLFNQDIFKALKATPPDKKGELQLTDGIQFLIDSGVKVMAVKLDENDLWLDISSPITYWNAMKLSYDFLMSN